MSKIFAILAGLFLLVLVASPEPAKAAAQRADGVQNVEQYDVSARRRHRHVRRYLGPRHYGYYRPYWGPRYSYYGSPYWGPRYYSPAPFPFFPFFGIGWW